MNKVWVGVLSLASIASASKRVRDRSDVVIEVLVWMKKVIIVGVEYVCFVFDGLLFLDVIVDVVMGFVFVSLLTERDSLRAGEGSDIGYMF